MPARVAIADSCSGDRTFDQACGGTGSLAPVPTHDAACWPNPLCVSCCSNPPRPPDGTPYARSRRHDGARAVATIRKHAEHDRQQSHHRAAADAAQALARGCLGLPLHAPGQPAEHLIEKTHVVLPMLDFRSAMLYPGGVECKRTKGWHLQNWVSSPRSR